MKLPIQYALSFPDRWPSDFHRMNFLEHSSLTFENPDVKTFRCLALAYQALEKGGNVPAIVNAANEVAVAAFLAGRIGFLEIPEVIEKAMDQGIFIQNPEYEDYVLTDKETRRFVESILK